MIKIIHYIGLDVHKNSTAVEKSGELRSYGTIGGKLADLDKLIKKTVGPVSDSLRSPGRNLKQKENRLDPYS